MSTMSRKNLAHLMTVKILNDRNLSKDRHPLEWDPSNKDSQYALVYEDCLISAKVAKKYYKNEKKKKKSKTDYCGTIKSICALAPCPTKHFCIKAGLTSPKNKKD
jgi:hypothetical protein